MNVVNNKLVHLALCVVLATASIVVNETLSHLGDAYWLLLWSLALIHLIISVMLLIAAPRKLLFGIAVVVLLIIGQWRAIEMIAMLTIWSLRGFAP